MSKFPEARSKIDRAYTHIDELQSIMDWFGNPSLHKAVIDDNSTPGTVRIGSESEPIPPQTSLVIGDAIHCLRAALDYAAFTLTKGNSDKKFISFPFGEALHELEATIKGGAIRVASSDALRAIVSEIKPYRLNKVSGEEGCPPLWALNKLDNIDKHRQILLTVVRDIVHVKNLRMAGGNFIFQNNIFIRDAGDDDPIFQIGGGPVMAAETSTTVMIVFGEPEFFTGEPVIPVLNHLAELVCKAVDILEPYA